MSAFGRKPESPQLNTRLSPHIWKRTFRFQMRFAASPALRAAPPGPCSMPAPVSYIGKLGPNSAQPMPNWAMLGKDPFGRRRPSWAKLRSTLAALGPDFLCQHLPILGRCRHKSGRHRPKIGPSRSSLGRTKAKFGAMDGILGLPTAGGYITNSIDWPHGKSTNLGGFCGLTCLPRVATTVMDRSAALRSR